VAPIAATGLLEMEQVLGMLHVNPSFESPTDGNHYIEGGGGQDVIFGDLGQNDIIGGSSNLFSLSLASMRPVNGDPIIFAGAGTEITRNDLEATATIGSSATAAGTVTLKLTYDLSTSNTGVATDATIKVGVTSGESASAIAAALLKAAQGDAALAGLGFTFTLGGSPLGSNAPLNTLAGTGGLQTSLIVNGPGPYSISLTGPLTSVTSSTGTPLGTLDGNAHARNASVIVANNGDIFDLVGTKGTDSNGFLTFNYDTGIADPTTGAEFIYSPATGMIIDPATGLTASKNYYGGTQFVIPRAIQLLDYTYGGPDLKNAPTGDIGQPPRSTASRATRSSMAARPTILCSAAPATTRSSAATAASGSRPATASSARP